MRFADVFLRLGCALVGWMILYTYVVWLAALGQIGCGPDGDELHRVLLGVAPVGAAAAYLLRMTRPFPDIQHLLRWLGVPLALLMPFAILNVWEISRLVYIERAGICSAGLEAWQWFWAPVQLAAIAVASLMVVQASRSVHQQECDKAGDAMS